MRNVAASVQTRLGQRRAKTGEDFNTLLVRYSLERLLYRLANSPHRDQFILKGLCNWAISWKNQLRPQARKGL